MMTDTPDQSRSIYSSVLKQLGPIFVGLVFVIIGVWMIQGGALDRRGELSVFMGWVGAIFFGYCVLVLLWKLLTSSGPEVVLSPSGFSYRRGFVGEIPWAAVRSLSIRRMRRSSFLRLELTVEARRDLEQRGIGILIKLCENLSNDRGLYITSSDLDISFAELDGLFRQYLLNYNPKALE